MKTIRSLLWMAALCLWHITVAAVDSPFVGTHFHDAGKIPLSIDSSIKALRLWDARVGWNYLQPASGRWNFESLDRVINEAGQSNIKVLLPLGLTPAWAAAEPARRSAYGPGNSSPPTRLVDWENYVRTVVTRYKGRIDAYEIWNEPNRELFYSGTVETLFRLVCSASRIIREIDPAARIVSPAPTDQSKGVQWLREFLDTGAGRCIDIVGFHFYTLAHEPPEAIIPLINDVRRVVTEINLGHLPIWNTEFGWYIENKTVPNTIPYKKLDPALAGAYLVRSLLIQAAMGIGRSFHYAWNNTRMGVIEPDTGERKITAGAYAIAAKWLPDGAKLSCSFGELSSCSIQAPESTSRVWWTTGARQMVEIPNELIGGKIESVIGAVSPAAARIWVDSSPSRIVSDRK